MGPLEYFEWDVETWATALDIWRPALDQRKIHLHSALELGARGGGLSLFLAHEYGLHVICSDLHPPDESAKSLHQKYPAGRRIEYAEVDCLKMPYPDRSFDVVVFKSLLGALGEYHLQIAAVRSMRRILKDGGVLLFAENLKSTPIHAVSRKLFTSWSPYWRYPDYRQEILGELFADFRFLATETNGFLAVFGRSPKIRRLLVAADRIIRPAIPRAGRYMVCGYAVK